MDPKFQTSFIPKKPLIQTTSPRPLQTTNFFSLLAVIIFVITLVAGGAFWGYKQYLTKHNATLEAKLNDGLSKFEPELITDWTRLDTRIEAVKGLLNQHLALSSFFDFLSTVTLKNVRFSSFRYSISAQKISVNMSGQATSFSAVALQSAEFLKASNLNYIKNPLFSNLNLDDSGNVRFDFTGIIDPQKIDYRNYVNNIEMLQTNALQTTVATSVATTTQR